MGAAARRLRAGAGSLAGRWLTLAYTLARPLAARGVSPDALTAWGVLVSAAVAAVAAAGGRWPLVAVGIVVVAGLLDNLDGAVAILSGRTTRWGYVLDSLADRLSDAAYLLALWFLGAPGPVCVAGGFADGAAGVRPGPGRQRRHGRGRRRHRLGAADPGHPHRVPAAGLRAAARRTPT